MRQQADPFKAHPEGFFWITVVISFVLLVHNGTEPLFIFGLALLPVLIAMYHYHRSYIPIVTYLIILGVLGRYTRYGRETYASDTLLAIRDYIGYFLAGKNPYKEIVWAQSGLTPFTYFPFSLYWYLPAQLFHIDLRYFEMLASSVVPIFLTVIGFLTDIRRILPVLAVVSLTPFIMDLSSDGSNDSSAVLLLLASVTFLLVGRRKQSDVWGIASAIVLALATSFKHYLAFYLLYFVPFVLRQKTVGGLLSKKYLMVWGVTMAVLFLPFVLTAPAGIWRSLHFIEISNWHRTWGWNVWVALRDSIGLEVSKQAMWFVRTVATASVCFILLRFYTRMHLRNVFIASSLTMFVYLMLSNWTTYAYFTFLLPLLGLSMIED